MNDPRTTQVTRVKESRRATNTKLSRFKAPAFKLLAAALLLPLVAGAQTVTITDPTPNAVLTSGLLTAAGTGQFPTSPRISKWVSYSLNGGPWQTAIGTTNWSVPNLVLTSGLNSFQAQGWVYNPYAMPGANLLPGPLVQVSVTYVSAPFITQARRLSFSKFGFTLNGASNATYTVQVCTNLASTNWSPLFSLTLTNNQVSVVDSNATNRSRFYRVVKN